MPARKPKETETPVSVKNRKTLKDFQAVHNKDFVIPTKIQAALDALGKDGWEYELEFMRLCNVSSTDFARYREQFADYYVPLSTSRTSAVKRAWAGSKALAQKMREMV